MDDINVLIVEDEPLTAMEIRSMLEDMGFEVVSVENRGDEALDVLDGTGADLVLMDINLKGPTDGIDTALKIREDYSMPIVYLTAYSDSDTLQRASKTEPEGYLVKPITEDDLHSTVKMALARGD